MTFYSSEESKLTVYNSASGYKSIIMKELVNIGMDFCYKYPFVDSLWIPQIMFTADKTCFHVNTIIKQVIPAVLFDFICKLVGQKSLYVPIVFLIYSIILFYKIMHRAIDLIMY